MINLSKGQNIDITKTNAGVTKFRVGLGWDYNSAVGTQADLDASCFILGANGKISNELDFVFYNNLESPSGLVKHSGDNRDGQGEGDDESLVVDFSKVTNEERLIFVVTIDKAQEKNQNFGQVNNAFIRILNEDKYQTALTMPTTNENEISAQQIALDDAIISKYDLSEDSSAETAMVFGELYKKDGEWKFKAKGEGFVEGLQMFVDLYWTN